MKGDITVSVETTGRGRTITVETIDGVGTVVIPAAYGSEITAPDGATVEGNTVTLPGAGTYTITVE